MSLQSKFNEKLIWLLLKQAIDSPSIRKEVEELSAIHKQIKGIEKEENEFLIKSTRELKERLE